MKTKTPIKLVRGNKIYISEDDILKLIDEICPIEGFVECPNEMGLGCIRCEVKKELKQKIKNLEGKNEKR